MRPELQRRVQRYGWDYSSPHYETGWQHQLWPAQERLLEASKLQAGEKILDVSCGTGLVTFPIAELIGEEGSVTGIDLSEGMLESASELAESKGINFAHFRHMDAEDLDFEDDTFDVGINSLGMMYYPEPNKAIKELFRVLKPGGRTAVLVWGRRNQCGWAEIFPIVDRRVNTDVCPMFFQLGTGDSLRYSLESAGFTGIESERFYVNLHYESDHEAIIGAFLGGAVAMAYRKFDEKTRDEAHAEYLESIEPYKNGNGYDIPGEFVICTGFKPE